MRLIRIMKSVVLVLSGVLLIFTVAIATYPIWQKIAYVEEFVPTNNAGIQNETETPREPETVHSQVIYSLAEGEQELVEIIIEIVNLNANTVFYLNVPIDSKVTLSKELYQELLVYSPGLPQYLKLAKMPAEFSEDYRMEGCTRILQEVLGVSISNWISTNEESMEQWAYTIFQKLPEEAETFWTQYASWVKNTTSNQSKPDRLMYYESFLNSTVGWEGTIPGTQEVDGFTIQKVHTQEKIEELMLKSGNQDTTAEMK